MLRQLIGQLNVLLILAYSRTQVNGKPQLVIPRISILGITSCFTCMISCFMFLLNFLLRGQIIWYFPASNDTCWHFNLANR